MSRGMDAYRLELGNRLVEVRAESLAALGSHVGGLVSSDDNYLSHGGGVSQALWRAAGPELAEWVRDNPTTLELGDVFVSPAGRLAADYLLHAITIDFDANRSVTVAQAPSLYRKVLSTAEERGCESLGLPLLASEVAGLTPRESSHALVAALHAWLNEPSCLTHVVVAALPATFETAVSELSELDGTAPIEVLLEAAVDRLKKPVRDELVTAWQNWIESQEGVKAQSAVVVFHQSVMACLECLLGRLNAERPLRKQGRAELQENQPLLEMHDGSIRLKSEQRSTLGELVSAVLSIAGILDSTVDASSQAILREAVGARNRIAHGRREAPASDVDVIAAGIRVILGLVAPAARIVASPTAPPEASAPSPPEPPPASALYAVRIPDERQGPRTGRPDALRQAQLLEPLVLSVDAWATPARDYLLSGFQEQSLGLSQLQAQLDEARESAHRIASYLDELPLTRILGSASPRRAGRVTRHVARDLLQNHRLHVELAHQSAEQLHRLHGFVHELTTAFGAMSGIARRASDSQRAVQEWIGKSARREHPVQPGRQPVLVRTDHVRRLCEFLLTRLDPAALTRLEADLERKGYKGRRELRVLEYCVRGTEDPCDLLADEFSRSQLQGITQSLTGAATEAPSSTAMAADILSFLGFPKTRGFSGLAKAIHAVNDGRTALIVAPPNEVTGIVTDTAKHLEYVCHVLLRFVSTVAYGVPPEHLLADKELVSADKPLRRASLGTLFDLLHALAERLRIDDTPGVRMFEQDFRSRRLCPKGLGSIASLRNAFSHFQQEPESGPSRSERARQFLAEAAAFLEYLKADDTRVFPRLIRVDGIRIDRWARPLVTAIDDEDNRELIFTDRILEPGEIYFMHPLTNPLRVDPILVPAGDLVWSGS